MVRNMQLLVHIMQEKIRMPYRHGLENPAIQTLLANQLRNTLLLKSVYLFGVCRLFLNRKNFIQDNN